MSLVIGLDIGGTKTAGLLVDGANRTLAATTRPTPGDGPAQLQAAVEEMISRLLAQAGIPLSRLTAIGVGIPGRVDAASGAIATAVNLNLDHYPLGAALGRAYGLPIAVENDVRAAALGAYNHLFPTGPARSLAFLNLGTGVSAGVVLNGRLYRGRNGMAGEIGHVVVDPDGALCNCGQRGCLETLIAGPALTARAAAVLGDPAVATPEALFRAAASGDDHAQRAVHEIVQRITFALQWLAFTYDVDQLVIGGGVTHSGAPFLNPVLAALHRLQTSAPLLQTMMPDGMVQVLPAGFNAGLWGAIHLARESHPSPSVFTHHEGDTVK